MTNDITDVFVDTSMFDWAALCLVHAELVEACLGLSRATSGLVFPSVNFTNFVCDDAPGGPSTSCRTERASQLRLMMNDMNVI
jgi:hypothetical protein